MKINNHIYLPGLLLIYCLMVSSCIHEETINPIPGPNPPDGKAEKAMIELYSEPSLYSLPASRAMANETEISLPMVLIFTGSDMNALFSEAAQSISQENTMKVELTITTSPCMALIVSNMPDNKFFNGATEVDFTPANLTAAFTGKTLIEIEREGLFKTIRLATPVQTELPFSTSTSVLPMAGIYQLTNGISSTSTIGSSGNEVELTRAVSKVTIQTTQEVDSIFDMHWMGVMNAPANATPYRTGTTIYADDFTHYLKSISGDGVTGMINMTGNTNAEGPIYLYESAMGSGTAFIIKATYGNEDFFYKLPFYDETNELYIDNCRNKHYIFTITKVGEGYRTMTDAMNSLASVLNYNITIQDAYSHEITTNGHYYLGFSNTDILIYDPRALTLENAFTVVTDGWSGVGVTQATITSSQGITVSPSEINLPSTADVTVTPISVTIPAAVTSARITVETGNLSGTVTLTRESFMPYTGSMALPYADYFSCELINRGAGNWLAVSDGKHTSFDGFIYVTPGRIYLKAEPNISSSVNDIRTGGEIYVVRDFKGGTLRKTKVFVSQAAAVQN